MLVNCVAYAEGKKIAEIATADIDMYLGNPGCFVWVALKDPTPEELSEMQHEFDLHELAIEDARHGHQRPKIEEYGDSLFVVLHILETVEEEMHVGEVHIFVGPNYVLSVRNRAQKGFTRVRARAEREPHLLKHGSAFVLYALMDAVVDDYFPALAALEERFERVEAQIFSKNPVRETIKELYVLRQGIMTLKRAVAPLHDALGKLYGGRVPALVATAQEYFRDISDHLLRVDLQRFVDDADWSYVCRTAKNTIVELDGEVMQLDEIDLWPGACLPLYDVLFTQQAYGPLLAIAWWRKDCQDPLYLVTNIPVVDEACRYYRKRMKIETFFSDQKSRGFQLHQSHISDPQRLHRVMIAACLAYIWMIYLGNLCRSSHWIDQIHRTDRCDLSLFQLGLDLLEHWLNEDLPILFDFRLPSLPPLALGSGVP